MYSWATGKAVALFKMLILHNFFFSQLKSDLLAMASVAQLVEHCPMHAKDLGSTPY